jgi:hypothetical protein
MGCQRYCHGDLWYFRSRSKARVDFLRRERSLSRPRSNSHQIRDIFRSLRRFEYLVEVRYLGLNRMRDGLNFAIEFGSR